MIAGLPGFSGLPNCDELSALLSTTLVEDPPALLGKIPVFEPGYVAELDAYRAKAKEAREWIANLERAERERTIFAR